MSSEPALLVLLGGLGFAAGASVRARAGHRSAERSGVGAGHTHAHAHALDALALGHAALWLAAGVRFGPHLVIVPFLVLFSVLLELSMIDFEQSILPNRITYPAIVFALLAIPIVSVAAGHPHSILGAMVGGAGYFLLLFLPAVIYPQGMGFGDVKLAGLMGLYLGWIDPRLILPALVIASLIGLLAGLFLLARRGQSRPYPFGPWLALGCVTAILLSGPLLASTGA